MNDSDASRTAMEDPVAAQWQLVREMDENRIDKHLIEAAHANPALRSLFPLVSHGSLQFSRCTRFPWSQDLSSIFPLDDERYCVLRLHEPEGSGRERIGESFTAEEAVEIVAAHLPSGWSPAVDGKPDILDPLS